MALCSSSSGLVLIDVKDNVSDTASESSSLDLDFFAPSIAQPSDGKTGMSSSDMLQCTV